MRQLKQDISAVNREIEASDAGPGSVLAVPHFSGSLNPLAGGRNSRAALLGMTLATTDTDLLKALMESVAYELSLTLRLLVDSGVKASVLRAAGGGTRSSWWMQLKADLMATPVEVVVQPEPGTFGAALLAGAAVGTYATAGQASEAMVQVERCYQPNERRRQLYTDRLATYRDTVSALLPTYRRLFSGLS